MSGSCYTPKWKRALYWVPGLFLVCPGRNYHWRWQKTCVCCDNGLRLKHVAFDLWKVDEPSVGGMVRVCFGGKEQP